MDFPVSGRCYSQRIYSHGNWAKQKISKELKMVLKIKGNKMIQKYREGKTEETMKSKTFCV